MKKSAPSSAAKQVPGARLRARWNLHTLSLVGMVLAMGYSGAVQNNGAAYLLCFLCAMLGAMSWLRARTNLRGLEIRPGVLPHLQAGQMARLPLELRATYGQRVSGLEILVVGSPRALFVDGVESGETLRVNVPVLEEGAGRHATVRLLVRSSYPLGLFNMERVVDLVCARRVHPRPAGDLPLPAPDAALAAAAANLGPAAGHAGREGDDFAGQREWQPGDSPRHIDWRALARGRPLLVKQWSSGAGAAVHLDWDSTPVEGAEQRAGQMARWVERCEAEAVPYALTTPATHLPPGLGAAHRLLCLDALAEAAQAPAEAQAQQESQRKAPRIPPSHEHSAHLPQGPLLGLSAMLLLAALPLLDFAAPASLGVLVLCMGWRLLMRRQVYRFVPLVVLVLGVLIVQFTEGQLFSMESGIAVLLVLLGAKFLESRTPHDFQVMAMIGWFLCLAGLLSEQTFSRYLLTLVVFTGICACMVRFRRGKPGVGGPLRLTATMLAQALPVAVVLFFIFPRSSVDFLTGFGTSRLSRTGIPSSLEPGRISQVAMSDELAFRAELPGGPPANSSRYWRCLVLWECDGLTWNRGAMQAHLPNTRRPRPGDVRQFIQLEAHGQLWIPSLDVPIQGRDTDGLLLPDHSQMLMTSEPVMSSRRVEVVSRLAQEFLPLPDGHRRAALQLPRTLSRKVRDLAAQLKEGGRTDEQIAMAAIEHLRAQAFQYSLNPGSYEGRDKLEEFLFERKVGFCEHFSAAFATLMRAADVPSRVVVGYLGGEWRPNGGWMKIKQSDAHAWTELWLEGKGWTRVDPTAALVPARVDLDLNTIFGGGQEALDRQRNSLWWRTTQEVRQWWDDLEYQWYTRIINFDEESQVEWLALLGWKGGARVLLLLSGGFVLGVLGLLSWWLRRPAQERDPWARAWNQFSARLQRLGLPARLANEGPLDYSARMARERPALAAEIQHLAGLYTQGRYGVAGEKSHLAEFVRGVRQLKA